METKTNALVVALVGAQASVAQVVKEAKNTFHGYKYASSESIIEAAGDALNKNGLAVYPDGWTVYTSTPKEGEVATGRLHIEYILAHVSGECRRFKTSTPIVPEKGRPIDKAESAAMTLNLAYFLRGLLLIAREDESSSVETRDDTKAPKKTAPVATPVDHGPWIAKISDAADALSLGKVGKELIDAKLSSVLEIRDAYMTAAKKFGMLK